MTPRTARICLRKGETSNSSSSIKKTLWRNFRLKGKFIFGHCLMISAMVDRTRIICIYAWGFSSISLQRSLNFFIRAFKIYSQLPIYCPYPFSRNPTMIFNIYSNSCFLLFLIRTPNFFMRNLASSGVRTYSSFYLMKMSGDFYYCLSCSEDSVSHRIGFFIVL